MKRLWKKDPPDGTNYAYWVSDDGYVIEVKPRFRPTMDYELNLPRELSDPCRYPIRRRTLALAKAAANEPIEKLRAEQRSEAARMQRMLQGRQPIGLCDPTR